MFQIFILLFLIFKWTHPSIPRFKNLLVKTILFGCYNTFLLLMIDNLECPLPLKMDPSRCHRRTWALPLDHNNEHSRFQAQIGCGPLAHLIMTWQCTNTHKCPSVFGTKSWNLMAQNSHRSALKTQKSSSKLKEEAKTILDFSLFLGGVPYFLYSYLALGYFHYFPARCVSPQRVDHLKIDRWKRFAWISIS